MAIPELLAELLSAPGPSGQETRAGGGVARRGASRSRPRSTSTSTAPRGRASPGTAGGPSLAVVGHIDEIGVHVTHIDDDGFLRFGQVGGWDPIQLVGQRILLDTRGGPVRGVIGRKAIHLLDEDERKQRPELKDLHIDIGAASGDEAT